MPTIKKRTNFVESAEGQEALQALTLMCSDSRYNTVSTFSADSISYNDNLIPFVDKHMKYLSEHKNLNPTHYIANLRLMNRVNL
jgi:hypothetical protein